ncbi:alpha-N-acetylglucosaminidase [Chitinophaga defluvii]|uniref:Alpha-N-acetylglucosaminidase n=1 Tax=Chitinophaga defluvii TaxID=3163343 RepID=A0ABV2TA64_9BACT
MHKGKGCWGVLLLLLLPAVLWGKSQPDFKGVYALTQRVVPWLLPHVKYETLALPEGQTGFELETVKGKIVIRATDVNTAATGLNWYLKYYCHRSMSHLGDNLSSVLPIPVVANKVTQQTAYPLRYGLNYCTHNYSMSFYTWKDWERELDWMALNGVNLMLAVTGTEAIWQRTLQQMGYSDAESRAFIAGPAFTAWWLMGNLEGWPGAMSQTLIDQQVALQQNILQRMKTLGISPVLQGFYGMVPTSLKHKMPGAAISVQGKWAGGFTRPDVLLATDSLFTQMAGIYYREMKKLYGDDIHYFGGDLFHEGGTTEGVDVTAVAKQVQQQMQQYFPGSTWVLQGWQSNPKKALLDGLNKAQVLVLELFGEKTSEWEKTDAYYGTPWLWCTVNNAGEKNGVFGRIARFAEEFDRARNSPQHKFLKGTGILPEGINNNPLVYDLMLELSWHPEKINVSEWIKSYTRYRYGKDIPEIQAAWQVFFKTIYTTVAVTKDLGPSESVFCARPAMGLKTVSTWGVRERPYDMAEFEAAVKVFAGAAAALKGSKTYEADLVDFTRQVLANRGEQVYDQMTIAFNEKNATAFDQYARQFMQMMEQQEKLLSCNPHFTLNTWLNAAYNMGNNMADKAYLIKNARIQVTYWGPDDPATELHEYACKEWSGMMQSYYIPRWKMFFEYAHKKLAGEAVEAPDYFSWEKQWTLQPWRIIPAANKSAVATATAILKG